MSQSQSKSKKQPSNSTKPAKPKPQTGWIWPKDPRPGNPTRWSCFKRFSDVLTGKGPDIYVGTIGKHPPPAKHNESSGRTVSSTNWARWDIEPQEDDTPFPWARRGKHEKYDYSTRKYGVPNEKTWSAVEYADCGWEGGKWRRKKKKVASTVPIRVWDREGRVHWCQGDLGLGGRSVDGGLSGSEDYCHCHCGLHDRDSAIGSYEHVQGHAYPIRSHCPGC
jgi:hypothetical protein